MAVSEILMRLEAAEKVVEEIQLEVEEAIKRDLCIDAPGDEDEVSVVAICGDLAVSLLPSDERPCLSVERFHVVE